MIHLSPSDGNLPSCHTKSILSLHSQPGGLGGVEREASDLVSDPVVDRAPSQNQGINKKTELLEGESSFFLSSF